jgi:Ca2+/Na+ antiporter
MELRKLKELWDGSSNSSIPINEKELNQILNKRSRRPIAIIKRNLKLEMAFGILFYCFFIWIVSNQAVSIILYFDIILLVVAGILYSIYVFYKNQLLNKMECMSCEVKSNLNLQLGFLEKLVKLYFKVVLLTYLIAGAIGYITSESETDSIPHYLEIMIFITIGAVLFLINYYFSRWYLFTLYGKHIQKLKNILYEMDESEKK